MTTAAVGLNRSTDSGLAEGNTPAELYVRSDVPHVGTSSRLAIHILAQAPTTLHASLPASDVSNLCLLLAQAYGIDERVEIRPPGATERAGDETLEVDATRSTPAALCDLFRDVPPASAGRRDLDTLLAGRRVALVTNIPIHYRVALFNVVAKRLSAVGGALHVLFTGGIPTDRSWISAPEMRFDHAFLTSIDLGRSRGRRMLPRGLGAHLSRDEAGHRRRRRLLPVRRRTGCALVQERRCPVRALER